MFHFLSDEGWVPISNILNVSGSLCFRDRNLFDFRCFGRVSVGIFFFFFCKLVVPTVRNISKTDSFGFICLKSCGKSDFIEDHVSVPIPDFQNVSGSGTGSFHFGLRSRTNVPQPKQAPADRNPHSNDSVMRRNGVNKPELLFSTRKIVSARQ